MPTPWTPPAPLPPLPRPVYSHRFVGALGPTGGDVTDPLLFVLGALHGLQPDHAVAAAGVSSRSGTAAWKLALRVAAGHTVALGVVAVALQGLPQSFVRWIEPVAGGTAGAALLLLGATLLFQAIRSRFFLHSHEPAPADPSHTHTHVHVVDAPHAHRHGFGWSALALGLVLGLGGARSAGILSLAAGGHLVVGLLLYGVGLALSSAATSGAFDLIRAIATRRGQARWVDVVAGSGSMVAGGWLLAGLFG